jgi:nucleotide-binding universal stress UspA family protein
MSRWSRICCAIDGSEPSRQALEHAVELALRERAALHVLHVRGRAELARPPFAPPPAPRPDLDAARSMLEWIRRAQERVPDLVAVVERTGEPAAEIVAYAEEWECDVIVLGTHARRGLERLVLGSVAEAVTRHARCPVLIVPVRPPGAERRAARLADEGEEGTGTGDDAPLWNP